MSLRQHCDVEDCMEWADIQPNSLSHVPDGWFQVAGARKVKADSMFQMTTPQGNEFQMNIPDRLIPDQLEMVTFVVCPKHPLPWRVRTQTTMGGIA